MGQVFRFGVFEADATRNTLTRNGVRVKIQDQPFRVLIQLMEKPGEVVTREELRQRLWPEGTYVDFDGSLNVILKKLRAAIDDASDNPRFIETVPRRGYRFVAPFSVETARATPGESARVNGQIPSLTVPDKVVPATGKSIRRPFLLQKYIAAGCVLVVSIGLGWFLFHRKQPIELPLEARADVPRPQSVAVLPFSNEGAGPDFDYLRYAIANELVTDLTHAHSVSVRPFSSTARYASQAFDPAAVGKELRVTHVVAGGFLLEKQGLRVNLELVDVALNQPVWHDEVIVSPQQLIALHNRLSVSTAKGMLPVLNINSAAPGAMTIPKDERALDLFLHSLSIPLEPVPNRLAIRKLEESVSLDDGYAPAWGELGWRYYLDFHYGNGGEAVMVKSLEAYERQSELDPNMPSLATIIRVEQGDLNGAYDQAMRFLRRRPDSSMAHFEMSYVLRYAGLLDEAGKECDAALALDPGFNGLRSCAFPFILASDYAHAQRYMNLDERFAAFMRLRIALRAGDTAAILADTDAAVKSGYSAGVKVEQAFFRACVSHAPEFGRVAAKLEADPVASHDPELLYQSAEALAFCGQADAAVRQLTKAIKANHCSYPAMDKDPSFDSIRLRPEFVELRTAAIQCRQRFLTHRAQVDAALERAQ